MFEVSGVRAFSLIVLNTERDAVLQTKTLKKRLDEDESFSGLFEDGVTMVCTDPDRCAAQDSSGFVAVANLPRSMVGEAGNFMSRFDQHLADYLKRTKDPFVAKELKDRQLLRIENISGPRKWAAKDRINIGLYSINSDGFLSEWTLIVRKVKGRNRIAVIYPAG